MQLNHEVLTKYIKHILNNVQPHILNNIEKAIWFFNPLLRGQCYLEINLFSV